MEFHEVANIFPMMGKQELEELAADIKANGLIDSIWTYEGEIVDGRNRFIACNMVDEQPRFQEWGGGTHSELVTFVVSLNLKRRHLNESQRAMIAGRLASIERGNLGAHQDKHANTSIDVFAIKQPQAAEMLNVSVPSIQRARVVIDHGVPALVDAVDSGDVSVSAASNVARLPEPEQEQLVARGEKEILAEAKRIRKSKASKNREAKIERITSTPDMPANKYNVIYADPPWRYDFVMDNADAIEKHYPTMELSEICALPVREIAASDCVLFIWTTSPKLKESFDVISAWGFSYTTCMIWDKEWIGPGYYARQQHEILLIAKKGELPVPLPENRPPSVYHERRTAHSRKPDYFHAMLNAMYPEYKKIELFARRKVSGWDTWGNEV